MGRSLDTPLDRPRCGCGAVVYKAGKPGEGVFTIRKTGQEAQGVPR